MLGPQTPLDAGRGVADHGLGVDGRDVYSGTVAVSGVLAVFPAFGEGLGGPAWGRGAGQGHGCCCREEEVGEGELHFFSFLYQSLC